MRVFACGVVGLAALIGLPRSGDACSFAGPVFVEVDEAEAELDSTPPSTTSASVELTRGKGPEGGCGSEMVTSCDDIGVVRLTVTASDDRTQVEDLGYEIALASGTLPEGLVLPEGAVAAQTGVIYLPWADGATDDQESLDFVLEITTVDRGGNRADAPTLVPISSAGRAGTARGANGGLLVVAAGVSAMLGLVRRPRRPARS